MYPAGGLPICISLPSGVHIGKPSVIFISFPYDAACFQFQQIYLSSFTGTALLQSASSAPRRRRIRSHLERINIALDHCLCSSSIGQPCGHRVSALVVRRRKINYSSRPKMHKHMPKINTELQKSILPKPFSVATFNLFSCL